MGKVYLIGAGPGDEELITVKAARVLKKCTAVMYDHLANDSILRFLDKDCKIYYCGKEPGCHYKTQEQINNMIVELAKAGHTVGRIKGGDPYVFGRGGEEVLRLYDEGIEFEVVPGITSAIAVPGYAGIPVTHRKIAQSFHVYTGKSAEKLNINWKAAVSQEGTLIFLMGLENIGIITENLMDSGMNKETPCAVIRRGTTSKQERVVGNIENIKDKVIEAGLKSPCIIIIGEVVKFHTKFDWYSKKPLHGLNICTTRSKEQSEEIRTRLLDLGAEVTEINTIEVKENCKVMDTCMDKLPFYDYIVFTSVNGVRLFFSHLREKSYDIRKIKASFAAIGPATEEAIKDMGIIPDIIGDEFVAEALFEKMKCSIKEGDKVLLPRSKKARTYLADALRDSGCIVDDMPLYDIDCGKINSVEKLEEADVILFTSPTTVRNFITIAGPDMLQRKECIAIGPITAKELCKYKTEYLVSGKYTIDGIIEILLSKYSNKKSDNNGGK